MKRARTIRPVHRALNHPTIIAGLDYRVFGAVIIGSALLAVLLHALLPSLMIAVGVPLIGGSLTWSDPKWMAIWSLSFRQSAHYDPAKRR